jgi:hypothetical protein
VELRRWSCCGESHDWHRILISSSLTRHVWHSAPSWSTRVQWCTDSVTAVHSPCLSGRLCVDHIISRDRVWLVLPSASVALVSFGVVLAPIDEPNHESGELRAEQNQPPVSSQSRDLPALTRVQLRSAHYSYAIRNEVSIETHRSLHGLCVHHPESGPTFLLQKFGSLAGARQRARVLYDLRVRTYAGIIPTSICRDE